MLWKDALVVSFALVIRIAVRALFPGLGAALGHSVEFSTPMDSYRTLEEGVYLLKGGFPIYDGGVVHQPPILVLFASILRGPALYAIFDAIATYQLARMTRAWCSEPKTKLKDTSKLIMWIPAIMYAVNPLTVLTCISQSSTVFHNAAFVSALRYALSGNIEISAVMIIIAGYLSVSTFHLVLPILVLFGSADPSSRKSFVTTAVSTIVVLLAISYKISGNNWNFLIACYWEKLTFVKVFPNLGLWWYFFIEMFHFFIPFFKAVFNLFHFSFILPITFRFQDQPLYAIILCLCWIALTKPYPTLGDTGLILCLLPYFQPLYGYLRYSLVTSLVFSHSMILSPLFYHLWINLGSGNSNFFYAISLVYNFSFAVIVADVMWAVLRYEYDNYEPNFSLKVTQI